MAVIGTVLVLVAFTSMAARGRPVEAMYGHWMIHNGPTGVMALWLGYLVTRREPHHRAGWLLVVIGALSAVHVGLVALVDHRMFAAGVAHSGQRFEAVAPSSMPLDVMIPWWFSAWLWVPVIVMATTVLLLVFPDGELPDGRRRYALHLSIAAATTLSLSYMIETSPWAPEPIVMGDSIGRNILVIALLMVGGGLLAVAVVMSISTLVGRWRHADQQQRRRMRPVVITATAFAVLGVALFPWQWVWIPTSLVLIWLLLGSYAFAIARYRLHDLDFFVSRAAVAAVLAVTLTATYLAIVVGVGQLVGRGRENSLLPLVAAGVVAVAFDPLRRSVRRLVDRLLYGHDHDAYEVLHGIADRLRSASSAEQVLTDVAQLLVRGTGAERIEIVTAVRGIDRVLAAAGSSDRPGALWAVPVVHENERWGHVRVFARSTADLAPGANSLVEDAAATLGMVLRNAQLTVELEEQVRALQRSSERLVHAHDEARRSLERDIHDGAQARLIALKIRLGMAERRALRTGDAELASLIDGTCAEVDGAIHTLRTLGHGLRPSALEGAGLAAAIRSEARAMPMDVIVEAPSVGRYDPAVESAVFFSCLEAIQNSAKHGRAGEVCVRLSNGSGGLTFSISDDGTGYDPERTPDGNGLTNLRDRLLSLGGEVRIEAAPGRGTTVTGHVPVQPLISER
jgi:two-component system, NarL family, sensor kinase